MGLSQAIADNLDAVNRRISAAARRAGRNPDDILLVAVSKTMPADAIQAAYIAGQRIFGENRVQEAEAKITSLAALAEIRWHLVGHLQTNKARDAVRLFHLVESVDSVRLAQALSRITLASGREISVLLEVNVAGEATKFGFKPEELASAAASISTMPGIKPLGLMAVAPIADSAERVRPVFRRLRQLRDDLQLSMPETDWRHLSMGMTGDFEVAIEEGSTMVRLGRAIFGKRAR